MPEINEKSNTIPEAQKDLGIPQQQHFAKKEPLLKSTFGTITSNLALTQRFDEELGDYSDPVPTYSLYFEEQVKTADGKMERKFTNIPLEKTSESLKAFGEHLIKVAKAIDGIELTRSAASVDDLDNALNKLKAFKNKKV